MYPTSAERINCWKFYCVVPSRSKDELLDTPSTARFTARKLEKRSSLGAFDAPKNVDNTEVSFSCSVTGPCGLYYFIRKLVRYSTPHPHPTQPSFRALSPRPSLRRHPHPVTPHPRQRGQEAAQGVRLQPGPHVRPPFPSPPPTTPSLPERLQRPSWPRPGAAHPLHR